MASTRTRLVLEHVTLALHVQLVVHVLVDLLRVAVLLQESPKHTCTTHPDDGGRKTRVLAPLALTESSVATLALRRKFLPHGVTGVHLDWLLDNKAILSELTDIETGIG